MEEIKNLEETILSEAVESGKQVRIVFTTGYQTQARILDFSYDVIVAEVDGKRWLIYRQAVSTIDLG